MCKVMCDPVDRKHKQVEWLSKFLQRSECGFGHLLASVERVDRNAQGLAGSFGPKGTTYLQLYLLPNYSNGYNSQALQVKFLS